MAKIFLISDHHFGHANVIKYERRPFCGIKDMDDFMIKKWNSVVGKGDKVFHLGDFSFYGKDKTKSIVSKLNGRKHLIMGNHDKARSVGWWKDCGFEEVSEFPIIYKQFYMFSHEPMYVNDAMPYLNFHGHTHSNKIVSMGLGSEVPSLFSVCNNKYINVCVEPLDYTPLEFTVEKYS